MARHVKEVKTCDWPRCGRSSETEVVHGFEITIDSKPSVEVDLCKEHSKPFDAAVAAGRRKTKRRVRKSTDAMDEALQNDS